MPKEWWRPRVLPRILPHLPPALGRALGRTAAAAVAMHEQLGRVDEEIKADAPAAPVGVGALTAGMRTGRITAEELGFTFKPAPRDATAKVVGF